MRADELAEIRGRLAAVEGRLATLRRVRAHRQGAFAGQVTNGGSMGTGAGIFYLVRPASVTAAAGEGGGSAVVSVTASAPVVVLGTRTPALNETVIAREVAYRHAADVDGPTPTGPITLPGCPCTAIPGTLRMVVTRPDLGGGVFHDATLVYGPTPPALASLALGANSFLSTTQFSDDTSPDRFWYYFGCFQGFYILTRVYLHSVFGSPFRDGVRYKWVVGFPGNTCSPFLLSQGLIYSGGNPACKVTLSG